MSEEFIENYQAEYKKAMNQIRLIEKRIRLVSNLRKLWRKYNII
jgi:hypothetical protein